MQSLVVIVSNANYVLTDIAEPISESQAGDEKEK